MSDINTGIQSPAPAEVPAPSNSGPSVAPFPGGGGSDFTPAHIAQMAKWEVEAGRLTPEQANEMLLQDGLAPIDAKSTNSFAAEIDAAFPPASPEQYEMPCLVKQGEEYTPALAALDKNFRGWLSTAKFPREIGSDVANHAFKTAEQFSKMNEGQRDLWTREQWTNVERIFGNRTQEKVALAQQLVDEIENRSPGLKKFLEESGAGSSPNLVIALAAQADRLAARAQGKW